MAPAVTERGVWPVLPNLADIDPEKLVVSYNRRSDTLMVHFFGRGRSTVSDPTDTFLYALVDPDTNELVGYHIEGFLAGAVKQIPAAILLLDFAELRGITPAEVRVLQRDTLAHTPERFRFFGSLTANTSATRRKDAVLAFIHEPLFKDTVFARLSP